MDCPGEWLWVGAGVRGIQPMRPGLCRHTTGTEAGLEQTLIGEPSEISWRMSRIVGRGVSKDGTDYESLENENEGKEHAEGFYIPTEGSTQPCKITGRKETAGVHSAPHLILAQRALRVRGNTCMSASNQPLYLKTEVGTYRVPSGRKRSGSKEFT